MITFRSPGFAIVSGDSRGLERGRNLVPHINMALSIYFVNSKHKIIPLSGEKPHNKCS